ncbi:MAG: hypothetical protein H6908_00035 [Hyphomicrobiales bacterium]|nr:hypothetical protein [Hyphomicrobiales bacterium]
MYDLFIQSWNFIGDNIASVIAGCALVLTIVEIHLSQRHNRLSAKPYLTTFSNKGTDKQRKWANVELMNNGTGPAFIKSFKVYHEGNFVCDTDYDEIETFLTQTLPKECNHHFETLGKDYSMPVNEKRNLLMLEFSVDASEHDPKTIINKFDLVVDYESIYGQKFTYDSRED